MTARDRFAVAWRAVRLDRRGRQMGRQSLHSAALASGWREAQARPVMAREALRATALTLTELRWLREHTIYPPGRFP